MKEKVQAVIDKIRPMLQADGGDVELVDVAGKVVKVRLKGACAGCAGASLTLKMMVEKTLKDVVDDRVRVIAI